MRTPLSRIFHERRGLSSLSSVVVAVLLFVGTATALYAVPKLLGGQVGSSLSTSAQTRDSQLEDIETTVLVDNATHFIFLSRNTSPVLIHLVGLSRNYHDRIETTPLDYWLSPNESVSVSMFSGSYDQVGVLTERGNIFPVAGATAGGVDITVVEGQVIDNETGEPVGDATLIVEFHSEVIRFENVRTDSQGYFCVAVDTREYPNFESGEHEVVVSVDAAGYEDPENGSHVRQLTAKVVRGYENHLTISLRYNPFEVQLAETSGSMTRSYSAYDTYTGSSSSTSAWSYSSTPYKTLTLSAADNAVRATYAGKDGWNVVAQSGQVGWWADVYKWDVTGAGWVGIASAYNAEVSSSTYSSVSIGNVISLFPWPFVMLNSKWTTGGYYTNWTVADDPPPAEVPSWFYAAYPTGNFYPDQYTWEQRTKWTSPVYNYNYNYATYIGPSSSGPWSIIASGSQSYDSYKGSSFTVGPSFAVFFWLKTDYTYTGSTQVDTKYYVDYIKYTRSWVPVQYWFNVTPVILQPTYGWVAQNPLRQAVDSSTPPSGYDYRNVAPHYETVGYNIYRGSRTVTTYYNYYRDYAAQPWDSKQTTITATPNNGYTGNVRLGATADGVQASLGQSVLTFASLASTTLAMTPYSSTSGSPHPVTIKAYDTVRSTPFVRTLTYDLNLSSSKPAGYSWSTSSTSTQYASVPGTPEQATLTVVTTPVNGPVFVNESSWGTAPKTQAVSPGTYTVRFGAVTGYNLTNISVYNNKTGTGQGYSGYYSVTVTLAANDDITVTGVYTLQPVPTTASLNNISVSTRSPSYKIINNTCTAYIKVIGSASWSGGDVSGNGTVTITGIMNWSDGTGFGSGSGSIARTVSNGAAFAEPGCPNWFDLPISIWASGQLGRYFDATINVHLAAPNGASSDWSGICPVFLYW